MKRTKILATIGPVSENFEIVLKMIEAGCNAFRCNFSHGTADEHRKRVDTIRRAAKKSKTIISILADLQGPKIRVAKFVGDKVNLIKNNEFILDTKFDKTKGTNEIVGVDYENLANDVHNDDILLLDDGKIVLTVKKVEGTKIYCNITAGGQLSNNKGINKQGGGLTAPALTDKDKEDLITAVDLDVDYIAISFPRDANDIKYANDLIKKAGGNCGVIAKIERVEAVDNIIEIIKESAGIMVARGDLAVEIGNENVPAVQKMIIHETRSLDKIVITATQMMESMITCPTPTRAEVSDVANAVLDGTDAVMLSAESAAGDYPVETVIEMTKVCIAAESSKIVQIAKKTFKLTDNCNHIDESIAIMTVNLANQLNAKAILCLTESGNTARWMSRINTDVPIYGMTRNNLTLGKMGLYRGVIPYRFDPTRMPKHYVNRAATDELINIAGFENGDIVILTSGDHIGVLGGTNKLKVIEIGNVS